MVIWYEATLRDVVRDALRRHPSQAVPNCRCPTCFAWGGLQRTQVDGELGDGTQIILCSCDHCGMAWLAPDQDAALP